MNRPRKDYNYDNLLERAKRGDDLPKDALSSIRQQLRSGIFECDPYILIHILGKARDIDSFDIIVNYLGYNDNGQYDGAMLRRIALHVLGHMWKDVRIFDLATHMALEDPSPYVRSVAATAVGTLGKLSTDYGRKAALVLLKGYNNRDPEEPEVWEAFYDGMLELLEIPISEWPSSASQLEKSDVRADVVAKITELASGK